MAIPSADQTPRRVAILILSLPYAVWVVLLMIRPNWNTKWEMVPLLPFVVSPDVWIQSRETYIFLWLVSILGFGIYALLCWLALRHSEPLIAVLANILLIGGSIAAAVLFVVAAMGSWSSG